MPIPVAAESVQTKRRRARRSEDDRDEAAVLDIDPLEDLCRIAEAYRKERGLTADEAIAQILTEIRRKD